jgi:hypothetical protein
MASAAARGLFGGATLFTRSEYSVELPAGGFMRVHVLATIFMLAASWAPAQQPSGRNRAPGDRG